MSSDVEIGFRFFACYSEKVGYIEIHPSTRYVASLCKLQAFTHVSNVVHTGPDSLVLAAMLNKVLQHLLALFRPRYSPCPHPAADWTALCPTLSPSLQICHRGPLAAACGTGRRHRHSCGADLLARRRDAAAGRRRGVWRAALQAPRHSPRPRDGSADAAARRTYRAAAPTRL